MQHRRHFSNPKRKYAAEWREWANKRQRVAKSRKKERWRGKRGRNWEMCWLGFRDPGSKAHPERGYLRGGTWDQCQCTKPEPNLSSNHHGPCMSSSPRSKGRKKKTNKNNNKTLKTANRRAKIIDICEEKWQSGFVYSHSFVAIVMMVNALQLTLPVFLLIKPKWAIWGAEGKKAAVGRGECLHEKNAYVLVLRTHPLPSFNINELVSVNFCLC